MAVPTTTVTTCMQVYRMAVCRKCKLYKDQTSNLIPTSFLYVYMDMTLFYGLCHEIAGKSIVKQKQMYGWGYLYVFVHVYVALPAHCHPYTYFLWFLALPSTALYTFGKCFFLYMYVFVCCFVQQYNKGPQEDVILENLFPHPANKSVLIVAIAACQRGVQAPSPEVWGLSPSCVNSYQLHVHFLNNSTVESNTLLSDTNQQLHVHVQLSVLCLASQKFNRHGFVRPHMLRICAR